MSIDFSRPMQYSRDTGATEESQRVWHDVTHHLLAKDGTVAVMYGDGLVTLVSEPHHSQHLRNKPETE